MGAKRYTVVSDTRINELLSILRFRGISLELDGGALHCLAPRGGLTIELLTEISNCQNQLIDFLCRGESVAAGRSQFFCRDGGMDDWIGL